MSVSCGVLLVPSAFLCIGLVCRSRSPRRPWRYPSFARGRSCDWGVSPCGVFRRSPWDSQWLHLYRLTPDLVSLRGLEVRILGLRLVFPPFPCAPFCRYSMAIVLCFMHVSA